MLVLAITGGLCSGKSTATAFFKERGAVVIDLDRVAHSALALGSSAYHELVREFGDGVLREDGTIDRAALAQAAFVSDERTKALNSIVHPVVAREVIPSLSDLRLLADPPPFVVIDIPLLVEAPVFAEAADAVLAIAAPIDTRLARAVEGGMSEEDARARIARQATDEQRGEVAHFVINNDGTLEEFEDALEKLWQQIRPRSR